MKWSKKNNRGFTLIELLVVIAIVGLGFSVVLASLDSARMKTRNARRISDVKQVKLAIEFYYDNNGFYPTIGVGSINVGRNWAGLTAKLAPYIKTISPDPSGNSWHIVQYVVGPVANNSYAIWVRREPSNYCKTGVNVDPGWWGTGTPLCNF